MIHFKICYPKFIRSLLPVNWIIKKNVTFVWPKPKKAFYKRKLLLADCFRLVHWNSRKALIVAADVSPHGLGALLSKYGESNFFYRKPSHMSKVDSLSRFPLSEIFNDMAVIIIGDTQRDK